MSADGLSFTKAEVDAMRLRVQTGERAGFVRTQPERPQGLGSAQGITGAGLLTQQCRTERKDGRLATPHFPTPPHAKYGLAPNGRPYKSKTEARYAAHLDMRQRLGEIREWRYEEVTLLIGHDTRYTPDFYVLMPNGTRELHEVKAKNYWRNGKTKFRAAAMRWPEYTFIGTTWEQGTWRIVERRNG